MLRSEFGKSTAWMSLAAGATSIVSFVIFVVLSRLLSPEEIGLVAFALIIVEIGKILINGGFSQAVIQKSEWNSVFASTCFYLNIGFSIAVALIVFFIVAPIAGVYFNEKAVPILHIFSFLFFLEGIKAVHEGKLAREFKFKIIAIRTVLGSLIPGAIGIYMAFQGFGVWALVTQQVLNQLIVSILTILTAKWKPSFTYSRIYAFEILHFATPLMGAQFITNLSSKLFEFLIAIIIGPAALGFYRVAGRALYIVQDIVLKPFEHTALSLLSRIEGTDKQADTVVRIISLSAFLIMPIFWGIAAISPVFISFAFGEKWSQSAFIMMILAIGLTPSMISTLVRAALTANRKSKMVIKIALISFCINCAIGFAFVPFGLEWAAIGFTVRSLLLNYLYLFWLRPVLKISISTIPKLLVPSCLSSTIMFVSILSLTPFINNLMSPIFVLSCLSIFGVLVYFTTIFFVFKSSTRVMLSEAYKVSPQKFKPYILSLQRFISSK